MEGFVLASLVACVGPLAVLGAFASHLGWGVAASGLAHIRVANLLPAVLLAHSPPAWSRRSGHDAAQTAPGGIEPQVMNRR